MTEKNLKKMTYKMILVKRKKMKNNKIIKLNNNKENTFGKYIKEKEKRTKLRLIY
jgi:hypothetical protein